jgi:N-acetylmuramoyl-L-alanine amidase
VGGKNLTVEYIRKSGSDVVRIITDKADRDLKSIVLTNLETPSRLAVDLPYDAYTGPKQLHVNTEVLKQVNVTYTGINQTRVILEFNGLVSYESSVKGGVITISLKNTALKNLTYSNLNSRPKITLHRTYLTEGSETVKDNYTIEYTNDSKVCTIMFSNSLGELAAGRHRVDDAIVTSVAVEKNNENTTLTINAKKRIFCSVYTTRNSDGNIFETNISLLELPGKSEKLVVIDAGHGGHDPGAKAPPGEKREKDYCLDIAQRLEKNLQRKGIKTFLIRNDDTYVALYERAILANDIKADLFISLHINAVDNNPEANGTETLYCPSSNGGNNGLNSEIFASIVQENLIRTLKTTDRKIKARPNLVVLRKTNMPAVLIEAAFITNEADLTKLDSTAFRRNTARAITDSVMEAFELLGK